MSACKGCEKALGDGNWEKASVIERKPGPGVYFQTPHRVWSLKAGTVEAFMVGTVLFCSECYEAQKTVSS